jgi:hypothetical protein
MYEIRKQLKIKVSLRRKIHIMALPHGTWNACLSAEKSSETPFIPLARTSPELVIAASDIKPVP